MFKMIRCAAGYDLVIMVSPPEAASTQIPGAKYYRYERGKSGFEQIDYREAILYFSGQTDGMGFERPREEPFATLNDALRYIQEQANEWARKRGF